MTSAQHVEWLGDGFWHRRDAVEEERRMGFKEYETLLAKSAWLLELAEHWRERDPEFAERLRAKARELQSADDTHRSADG